MGLRAGMILDFRYDFGLGCYPRISAGSLGVQDFAWDPPYILLRRIYLSTG